MQPKHLTFLRKRLFLLSPLPNFKVLLTLKRPFLLALSDFFLCEHILPDRQQKVTIGILNQQPTMKLSVRPDGHVYVSLMLRLGYTRWCCVC
jgi:hypothetical protein